jgi:hypothetical protein
MKWFVLFLVLGLAFCFVAFAEEGTTSDPTYSGSSNTLVNFENYLVDTGKVTHSHQFLYEQTDASRNFEYGAGLDLVVYQAEPEREGIKKAIPDEVTIESKYDFANEEGQSYVVAKYNIWNMLKKKTAPESRLEIQ